LLIEQSCLSTASQSGLTALHCGAMSGRIAVATVLIENGAAIRAKNKVRRRSKALMYSVIISSQHVRPQAGDTPLLLAFQKGHKDMMVLLLNNGADVFQLNKVRKHLFGCQTLSSIFMRDEDLLIVGSILRISADVFPVSAPLLFPCLTLFT